MNSNVRTTISVDGHGMTAVSVPCQLVKGAFNGFSNQWRFDTRYLSPSLSPGTRTLLATFVDSAPVPAATGGTAEANPGSAIRHIATILMFTALAACGSATTNTPLPTPPSPARVLAGTWTNPKPVKFTTIWDMCRHQMDTADTEEWKLAFVITPGSDDFHVKVQMTRAEGRITSSSPDCYNRGASDTSPVAFDLPTPTLSGLAVSGHLALTDPAANTVVGDCNYAASAIDCGSFVWKTTRPLANVPGQTTTTTETATSGFTLTLRH